VGSCEYSNELLGSIKGKEFVDYLGDYYFLKDSTPWSQSVISKIGN
jgi:hypothetical protein